MTAAEQLERQLEDLEAERLRILAEREALALLEAGVDVVECAALGPLCLLIDLDPGELNTRIGAVDTMLLVLDNHAERVLRLLDQAERDESVNLDRVVDGTGNIIAAAEQFTAANDAAADLAELVKGIARDTKKTLQTGWEWLPWVAGGLGGAAALFALWRATR